MTDDLKKITAKEWRHKEKCFRADADIYRASSDGCLPHAAQAAGYSAAADYCAKMAEEAEGREACARGEHDPARMTATEYRCIRCKDVVSPTDEPSAEDVRIILGVTVDGPDLTYRDARIYDRVWSAVLRDYAERRGIK